MPGLCGDVHPYGRKIVLRPDHPFTSQMSKLEEPLQLADSPDVITFGSTLYQSLVAGKECQISADISNQFLTSTVLRRR